MGIALPGGGANAGMQSGSQKPVLRWGGETEARGRGSHPRSQSLWQWTQTQVKVALCSRDLEASSAALAPLGLKWSRS